MKTLLITCFCCIFGIALFAAKPDHTILVYPKSGAPIEFVEKAGSIQPLKLKNGGNWYRIYLCAESSDWQEVRFVMKPAADGKIRFNLRAPKESVAEFGSFQVNGEELLKEPVVSPYSKEQPGIVVKCTGEAGKELVVVAKIRKSEKTLADFAQK